MKLRYTRPAANDLEEVVAYVKERSPQAAVRVRAQIMATIATIGEQPKAWPHAGSRGMRRAVVKAYPYLIFYREWPDTITIHAIRHGARSPSSMPVE